MLEHDHVIDWKNVKILKSEPHVNRRRTTESFLINQKAEEFNVLNHNDGAILPAFLFFFFLIILTSCEIPLKVKRFKLVIEGARQT